jgi:transposase
MRAVERQLDALAAHLADVPPLQTVSGVGLVTATTLVALVTDIRRFPSGRHFASFLGLTPREDSSAARRRLGAITKQGDVYVRTLLTHGARSVVWHATGGLHRALASWRTGRTGAGYADNSAGHQARASDWHPARGFHDGPEPTRLHARGRRADLRRLFSTGGLSRSFYSTLST